MIAKDGKKYALIANGIVSEIFDSTKYKEWNEAHIHAIELTNEMLGWVEVGMSANADNSLTNPSIEQYREKRYNFLASGYESELLALDDEYISADEKATYELQYNEAILYKRGGNDASLAPFLKIIADLRKIALNTLADKVIEKNTAYKQKSAQLLANYQILRERVKNARTWQEVKAVEYISPFAKK